MLKKLLIAAVIIIAGLTIFVATQPEDFNVSKNITISAPASEVYSQVNNFHKWEAWSPWAKLDANAQTSFEGAESGVGAITKWSGNKEVGEGSMTIVESINNEFIKIALEMTKPLAASNTTEFSFKEENGQTSVTWTMYGKKNFVGKAMGIIFNCNEMVGKRFEEGLVNLKTLSEQDKVTIESNTANPSASTPEASTPEAAAPAVETPKEAVEPTQQKS